MFDTIGGLPLHPLVVHATEVIVPAAALALILAALWPWFRRWAGWGPLGLAVASVILVPISTQSGESLEESVGENAALERRAGRREGRGRERSRPADVVSCDRGRARRRGHRGGYRHDRAGRPDRP